MTAEKTLDATSLALGPLTMSWRGSVTVTPGHGGGGDVGLAALRVGGWRVGRTHHRVSHAVGPGADGGHGTGGPGFCSRWQGPGSPACGEWRWEGLAPRVSWYLPRSANRPQTGCQSVGCDLESHPGATKPPESGFLRFRVPVPSPLGPGLVRSQATRSDGFPRLVGEESSGGDSWIGTRRPDDDPASPRQERSACDMCPVCSVGDAGNPARALVRENGDETVSAGESLEFADPLGPETELVAGEFCSH